MSIRHAILGFLSWRPATGYELKKLFSDLPFLHWSGNNNQIYRTLVELHREGLVAVEVEQQESLPARKTYTIARRGLDELRDFVGSAPELPERRCSFLVQLAWADLLEPATLDALLERYEREVELVLAALVERARRGMANPARTPREEYLWEMAHENIVEAHRAELTWTRKLRAGLRELERKPRGTRR